MMKTYAEQRYPVARRVLVVFPDDRFVDGIKGLSVGHALWRARWNWDGAEIVDLGPDE